jgi:predicted MPP superfamily phosphohydrolase
MASITRRKFFSRALTGMGLVAAAGAADILLFEPRAVAIEHVEVKLNRLPEAFHGFRIVQISDIHFGPYMGRDGVQRAVDIAKKFHPDLVVLTGDFVSHPFNRPDGPEGTRFAEPCADVLAGLKGIPTMAVLGNHDYWTDPNFIAGAFKDRGITVLRNSAVPVERGNGRLWISGVDDVFMGAADLTRALKAVPIKEATVLLAHEPDFADYAARFPVDLQLSGHSHGGQVRLPGIGALILPAMARKYPIGLNRVGNLQVYTNRGLGVITPPVRFHCPPEVTFVTLVQPSVV